MCINMLSFIKNDKTRPPNRVVTLIFELYKFVCCV